MLISVVLATPARSQAIAMFLRITHSPRCNDDQLAVMRPTHCQPGLLARKTTWIPLCTHAKTAPHKAYRAGTTLANQPKDEHRRLNVRMPVQYNLCYLHGGHGLSSSTVGATASTVREHPGSAQLMLSTWRPQP
jgi:hypothetical protein